MKYLIFLTVLFSSLAYGIHAGQPFSPALIEKATEQNDLDKPEHLINESNVNTKDDDGWTPLYLAVDREKYGLVEFLIVKKGADVNARNGHSGWAPLHLAAYKGNYKTIKLLIEAGADVNAIGDFGSKPLHLAAGYNKGTKIAKLLIEEGADVNARDDRGWTPLHLAAGYNKGTKIAKLLIEAGADIDAGDDDGGNTPLDLAKFKGNSSMIDLLLNYKKSWWKIW